MKTLRIHGPVLLLMMALAFIAFGNFMRTPLWDPGDAQILIEAHQLNQDPGAMFGHIGFYFSQPLLQLAFLAEYRLFGLDMAGYIFVNLLVHAFNAFLVYMLVNMLFPNWRLALLAAVLFVFGVGSLAARSDGRSKVFLDPCFYVLRGYALEGVADPFGRGGF